MIDEQTLKAIARQIALDVPILRTAEQGNRLTLYLYGGGQVEIQRPEKGEHPVSESLQQNASQTLEEQKPEEGVLQPKPARKRRQTHGHD